ncbi:MAG: hypothetical protein ACRDHL_01410 [Candidatus Promineifilaceae bacterium]
MKHWFRLPFLALLALVALAACGSNEPGEPEAPPPALAGPALVMFYTDN